MESVSDIVKYGEIKGEMSEIDKFASNLNVDRSNQEAIEKVFTIEETLLEIFRNLDAKSIKAATLVCPRWNEVISSSQVLMKGLKLNANKIPKNEVSTRKYWDVTLSNSSDTECRIFDSCYETSQIRSFSVSAYDFTLNWSKFGVLLSNMPNLESLEIDLIHSTLDLGRRNTFLIGSFEEFFAFKEEIVASSRLEFQKKMSSSSRVKIVLPNLKRLKVEKNSLELLYFLDAKQLTELDIDKRGYISSDRDIYINFLKQARNLKTWTMHHYDIDLFQQEEKFPFQLTTLRIENYKCYIRYNINRDNFVKFLIDQMPTITEITFISPDEWTCTFVLAYQVGIEKLTITGEYYNSNGTHFGTEIKPLNSLKTLTVDKMQFLSKFPNLEEIICSGTVNKANLKFMATYLRIKHLEFKFKCKLKLTAFEATFRNLTSLAIWGEIEEIYRFVQCCPILKVLEIQNKVCDDTKKVGSFVHKILRNTNVQHLKLVLDVDVLEKFFDELKSNYGESRKLKLSLNVRKYLTCNGQEWIIVQDTLEFPSFSSYKIEELYKNWKMETDVYRKSLEDLPTLKTTTEDSTELDDDLKTKNSETFVLKTKQKLNYEKAHYSKD